MSERLKSVAEGELEAGLRIDPDDLDSCLVSQPELFREAGDAVSLANSRRDGLKLEVKETEAELFLAFRRKALNDGEKATEAYIEAQITISPRIKKLQREYLAACTEAENCTVLKDAYKDRSFMLREEVAMHLARFYNLGVERGAVSARHNIGDSVRLQQEQMRMQKAQRRRDAAHHD